jgi:RNA polymerase sigma factor (sigma-70 family)
MTDQPGGPGTDGLDVAALYPLLARRLTLLVARRVAAPDAVIEDACQVAWSRLIRHRHRVAREAALAWLTTTAVRAALRALERECRERSLDDEAHGARVITLPARAPGPDHVTEMRERLAQIRVLPVRQQRIVWLHGLGYGYTEIAARTGDSRRTVERQLLRAKARLRDVAA